MDKIYNHPILTLLIIQVIQAFLIYKDWINVLGVLLFAALIIASYELIKELDNIIRRKEARVNTILNHFKRKKEVE